MNIDSIAAIRIDPTGRLCVFPQTDSSQISIDPEWKFIGTKTANLVIIVLGAFAEGFVANKLVAPG
jgi:hypothetical protein